ncbi:hypothetical protein V8B55DRAFT_1548068 [Mucor lusitanicus]|uniref:Uncharacterized protein n=2 Tax=Mucor circinelloides f. lusitanicus TaxID=29924 RepID=A0A8H4B6Y3_MUCCL|nr:hypothetical protein FB192DRAFT_1403874 [Mucor lusitanicus]
MSYNTFQPSSNSTHPNKKCKYSTIENPQCHLLHPQNNQKPEMMDVSQHLRSLRARLGFARFKLNQGWEKSTIFDVEQLWRQKQRKNINDLPRPRFTQREIIDKRMYIPSPGARQARAKRDGLVRTLSNPIDSWPESSPALTSKKNQKQLYFHHYHQPTSKETTNSSSSTTDDNPDVHMHQKRSISAVDECPLITDDGKMPQVRNSLEYLSYAIAMTEKQDSSNSNIMYCSQPLPDISEMEPNLMDSEDQDPVEELSITSNASPPSSPTTSAAKAIMMFVNNCNSSPSPSMSTEEYKCR